MPHVGDLFMTHPIRPRIDRFGDRFSYLSFMFVGTQFGQWIECDLPRSLWHQSKIHCAGWATGSQLQRQENEYIDPCFRACLFSQNYFGKSPQFFMCQGPPNTPILTYGISGMVIYPWELKHHLYINPYGKGLLTIPKTWLYHLASDKLQLATPVYFCV